ncbi:MAG: ABC transporter substrate-binding protein [Alphaproteobacteria bacterium]|nr:ABC transporter substrate-binding protein [Alphaproteobacteria bacterium]
MLKKTLLATVLALSAGVADAQNLRIGLREDPDILDPTLARTFVGRIVFSALCDKLFDINERLEIVPQLAESHRWEDNNRTLRLTIRPNLRFHDGEVLDAEAVRYSLNRHLTMQGSFRRAEISVIESIEVVDARTVLIKLREASSPFLSQLTDRAGMIVSPRAAETLGRNFGTRPVCAGPFRFTERVAQDRIVLDRFDGYWNAQNIHVNRVTFLPIPDSTVRLANLQSGALEMVQTIDPDDVPAVRRNNRLRISMSDELGFQSIQFNVANGARAQSPIGQDARVRQAFELSLDRTAINQVVYEGMFTPTAQPFPPASPFHLRDFRPEPRNIERARALLREAGVRTPLQVDLTVPNNPDLRQVGEVIQAMAREAGFDVRLNAMEFASSLQAATRGEFEAYLIAWSGRADPDGNIYTFLNSRAPNNDGRYSNPDVDRLLDAARLESDVAKRRDIYARIMEIAVRQDRARIYLWHRRNIVAHTARLTGFVPVADGLIRIQGIRLN